jgi:hypothetical protein
MAAGRTKISAMSDSSRFPIHNIGGGEWGWAFRRAYQEPFHSKLPALDRTVRAD